MFVLRSERAAGEHEKVDVGIGCVVAPRLRSVEHDRVDGPARRQGRSNFVDRPPIRFDAFTTSAIVPLRQGDLKGTGSPAPSAFGRYRTASGLPSTSAVSRR
jgi:hypothetical protein